MLVWKRRSIYSGSVIQVQITTQEQMNAHSQVSQYEHAKHRQTYIEYM